MSLEIFAKPAKKRLARGKAVPKTSVFFLSFKDPFYGDLPRRFSNYRVWIFMATFGFESGEMSKNKSGKIPKVLRYKVDT